MKLLLLIMLLAAASAIAETCIPSGSGYTRSYPPPGTTLNHTPISDPRCTPYMRDTLSDARQMPLCFMCHYSPRRIG